MILFRGDDYMFDGCNDNYFLLGYQGDDFNKGVDEMPKTVYAPYIPTLTRLERKLLDLLKKHSRM